MHGNDQDYALSGHEGRSGYDLECTRAISDAVDLPVVASGGAGTLEHFYEAVVIFGRARILLAASVFHYRTLTIRQVKDDLHAKVLKVIRS